MKRLSFLAGLLGIAGFILPSLSAQAAEADEAQSAEEHYRSGIAKIERRLGKSPVRDFQKACDLGHGEACYRAADMLIAGEYSSRSSPRLALQYFEKACVLEHPAGCHRYADRLAFRHNADLAKPAKIFAENCARGYGASCYERGKLGRKLEETEAQQKEFYRLGCEGHDKDACYQYASYLKTGRGGDVDETTSRTAYAKSCDLGHAEACGELMFMQALGKGGPVDMDAARATEKKRCALPGVTCD